MCTLTVVSSGGMVRVACSRDEQRTRARGEPSAIRRVGSTLAAYPLDPDGGGTWIAATERGLVLALLNLNDGRPRPVGAVSRGGVIPALAEAHDFEHALLLAGGLDTTLMAGFRGVICDGASLAVLRGGRGRVDVIESGPLLGPRVFASSGLGDEVVRGPRERLFAQMMQREDHVSAQREYHRHRWPDAGHISVDMERDEARTVSLTTIEVRPGASAVMEYAPRDDAGWGRAVRVVIPMIAGVRP